jgi:hypothetical protein
MVPIPPWINLFRLRFRLAFLMVWRRWNPRAEEAALQRLRDTQTDELWNERCLAASEYHRLVASTGNHDGPESPLQSHAQ